MAATHTQQPSLELSRHGWRRTTAATPPASSEVSEPPSWDLADLATSQPSWERWLGDSHFSHLLWLRHRDCSFLQSHGWVVIRWQPMATVPRGRGRQARSHLCVWRGRRTAAIELSPAMLRMAALTERLCPSHSRWLKWLSPSHLTQDGCDVAS